MWKLFDNFYVRRIASLFLAIVDIRYWLGSKYNSIIFDKWLWESLNRGSFEREDQYTAHIINTRVWLSNHPYASGCTYSFPDGMGESYPTLITRYRLKALDKRWGNKIRSIKDVELYKGLK